MNKYLKKFCLVLFAVLIMVSFINVTATEGEDAYSHLYRENEVKETEIATGVNYTFAIGDTQTTKPVGNVAGYGSKGEIELNTWYGQQINMVDVKPNENLKVVPWSIQNNNQWTLTNIIAIAKDFEKNNPGWIVLAGVNADFFDWHTRKDYPNSGSGIEVRYNEVIRCGKWSGAVSLNNSTDGSEQLTYANYNDTTFTPTPNLYIYDENGVEVQKISLNKVNSELSDGETGVYFGRYNLTLAYDENGEQILDAYGEHKILSRIYQNPVIYDGSKYLVQNASKVIQQVDDNSFYGKGAITEIDGDSEIEKDDFCIITKNDTVKSYLEMGTTIKVQYDLTGVLEGKENVMSIYQPLVLNGVWQEFYTDSYFTTRAPRTLVGSKDDGSIGIITMDGRQSGSNFYGTNQEEINAVLEAYDYTNAFLLDGGGSSSFIVRNGDAFDIVNSPSDGSIRAVANGLFVVLRDPQVDHKVTALSQDGFTINASVAETYGQDITKLYVKINEDDIVEVKNGKVELSNLKSNTEYSYRFLVEDSKGVQTLIYTQDKITTLKKVPTFKGLKITETEDTYILRVIVDDPDEALETPSVKINETLFIISNNELIINKNRIQGEISSTSISISYRLGGNNNINLVYENADLPSTFSINPIFWKQEAKLKEILK